MIVPLAVLADYANVTADNKLNILGIYDTIYGASLPVEVPSIRLVIQFKTEQLDRGTTITFTLKMYDAEGHDLLPYPLAHLFTPEDAPPRVNHYHVAELRGVSFEAYGDYVFVILVNDQEAARIPFHVQPFPGSQDR